MAAHAIRRIWAAAAKGSSKLTDTERVARTTRRPARRKPAAGGPDQQHAAWKNLKDGTDPMAYVQAAEKLLTIRTKAAGKAPLIANPAQQLFEERHGTENIVLKARQMGLSTWIAGRFLLRTLSRKGTSTLMVAHTRESAAALFTMVGRMWQHLPDWLQEEAGKGRRNVCEMTFPNIDSEFRIASAGEANAGRGLSVQNLHCSEVARWPGDPSDTLAGLRAALAPGGQLVLESTPNGAYGCFHAEWQAAPSTGMVRHFFPWWLEPGYQGAPATQLSQEELELRQREGLSAEQIGFRRELRRRFGALCVQEFAEDAVSCFRSSGSCFFDPAALEQYRCALQPAWEFQPATGLQIWLPPVRTRRYIVSADAAGGGSTGDFAAVQVVDRETGVQCAELQARLSPRDLASTAAKLARDYNGALLAVERNNHGAAVVAYLEKELAGSTVPIRLYEGRDKMPGWLTDAASRPRMLGDLAALLSAESGLFRSERLLGECRSFVTDAHGRPAAAPGAHDDLVMSMAIAQAVRVEVAGRR